MKIHSSELLQKLRWFGFKVRVKCLTLTVPDDAEATSRLTLLHTYEVLSVEADMFRIFDNRARPGLFTTSMFEIVDPAIDQDWRLVFDSSGAICGAGPPEFMSEFFWEQYFDHCPKAVETVAQYLEKKLKRRPDH